MRERDIAGLRILDSGSGFPVVLLHAFPVNAELYTYQLRSNFEGFRLLAPDFPGFGRSPYRPATSIENYADRVVDLLDAEDVDRCVLCGTSMGGYVAFSFLRRSPERVAALVLADTRAGADSEDARSTRETTARRAETEGVDGIVEELVERLLSASTLNGQPDIAERVLRMGREADPRGVAGALRAMAARPDASELLSEVRVPTLVIVGAEDTLTPPREAEAMVEQIPEARLEVVPDAGHLTPMEAPDTFNSALRTLLFEDLG